jgi:hypothetical protein
LHVLVREEVTLEFRRWHLVAGRFDESARGAQESEFRIFSTRVPNVSVSDLEALLLDPIDDVEESVFINLAFVSSVNESILVERFLCRFLVPEIYRIAEAY